MKQILFYTATLLTVALAAHDNLGLAQRKSLELAQQAVGADSKTLTLLNSTNAAALYANQAAPAPPSPPRSPNAVRKARQR
jgi:hypothetical protein